MKLKSIQTKWQNAKKISGSQSEIITPSGVKIKGTYFIAEVGSCTPSHDANNNFAPFPGFPQDENGQSVNDRDYFRDKEAQQITLNIAACYDARAIQNPVIVSPDGVVLSGNGRTIAGEIAATNNTDKEYIKYLCEYAHLFGFEENQIPAFAHPRILFVTKEKFEYNAKTFAMFNAKDMKSQNKTETAVKYGKLITDDSFMRILSVINGFETLAEFYANTEAATRCINELQKSGIIDAMSFAEMFDGDTISTHARETLENVLIGKGFVKNPDCVRMITNYKSLRKSVVFALSEIVNNLCLKEEFSLNNEIHKAVELAYTARNNGYKSGERVSAFARQIDVFSGKTNFDFENNAILVLADALNDKKDTLFKKIVCVYNCQAKDASDGQTDMFSENGIKTKKEILEEVRTIFATGSTEEKKQAENNAIQKRTSENIFISEEVPTKIEKGGYVEFKTYSGENVVCEVEKIKDTFVLLKGEGFNLWAGRNEVKPTANHNKKLPEWLQVGKIITDGKRCSQRIKSICESIVSFDWINGGVMDVNISDILTKWKPSTCGVCLLEN